MGIKIVIFEDEKISAEIHFDGKNSKCNENNHINKMTPEEIEAENKEFWWFL